MTSASLMHEAGYSKPVIWDNPEGWNREEGGRGVQDGGTHVHPWLIHVAAAAAKSLQSCLTLCDPTDGSPPGSPWGPWDSSGKNTGVGCLQCMHLC